MSSHKPTLIRAIKSVVRSNIENPEKGEVIRQIIEDAKLHDPLLDEHKLLKGAGFDSTSMMPHRVTH